MYLDNGFDDDERSDIGVVAEVHSLNQYSKGKRVYYGYSYG